MWDVSVKLLLIFTFPLEELYNIVISFLLTCDC